MARLMIAASIVPVLLLAGCGGGRGPSPLPGGSQAYSVVPEHAPGVRPGALQVGDRLLVRVLGEPDLTSDQYRIDDNGNLQVPLVGVIQASGKTPIEVVDILRTRLGEHYLRDPQVALSVLEHAKAGVTVEGDVREPGRFEVTPGLTLLGAVALGKSTTQTTKLSEVVIFRVIDNKRMGARFNLRDVREGRAPDPQIIAGDTVVVGKSGLKQFYRDMLATAPLLNLFYILR